VRLHCEMGSSRLRLISTRNTSKFPRLARMLSFATTVILIKVLSTCCFLFCFGYKGSRSFKIFKCLSCTLGVISELVRAHLIISSNPYDFANRNFKLSISYLRGFGAVCKFIKSPTPRSLISV
jgi:hypothetical protein